MVSLLDKSETDGTTKCYNDGEVLSGVQRRRRWTPEEKVRIVEETYLPGMRVSLVARQHGISGSQVLTWCRLMNRGALTAAAANAMSIRSNMLSQFGITPLIRHWTPRRENQPEPMALDPGHARHSAYHWLSPADAHSS